MNPIRSISETSASSILLRMRDVIFALALANKEGVKLNKIQIQKFVYLIDSVSYLFNFFPPSKAHITYENGPWDAGLQNAVDALSFRGFVKVEIASYSDLARVYSPTEAGSQWSEHLCGISAFSSRWNASAEVAKRVSRIGWKRLKSLVYAEPTYLALRAHGYGQELHQYDAMDVSTASFLQLIEFTLKPYQVEQQASFPLNTLIDVYFEFLEKYASKHGIATKKS